MRFLFAAFPGLGHVLPMLPLARAAQRAGHEVVIATGQDIAPTITARGFETWEVGPTRAEIWKAREERQEEYAQVPADKHIALDFPVIFGTSSHLRAEELVPRAEAWGPDIVVHEVSEFAGAIVARRTNAQHFVHGLGLMPSMVKQLYGPTLAGVFEPWGVPELAEEIFEATYIDFVPALLQPGGPAAFVNVQPIRPTAGDVVPGDSVPSELDKLPYDHTVYLTLGTIFHDTRAFAPLVEGLRELPTNVIVTVGPETDPARLGPQPSNVFVAPYLPQALVLPRVQAVVSHGGAGTVYGAFAHGLPQLVIPQGADQFMNAAASEAVGAAIVLQPDVVTPEGVRNAVERLRTEDAFRVAAKRVQVEIEARPSADEVLAAMTATMR